MEPEQTTETELTVEVSENHSAKPSKKFLENTKMLLNKRIEESQKIVDEKKPDWDKYRDMYNNIIKRRDHTWESNLIIPKAYYIIQTMTPWIMSAIFNTADFLTLKSPNYKEDTLVRMGKWFTWFMLRKMHLYMRYVELFTDSPITGTSLLKLPAINGVPQAEFLKVDDFLPDPRCRKPGDVDSMLYCCQKFSREFGQLEQAKTLRVRNIETQSEVFNQETEQLEPVLTSREVAVEEPLYFNLKEVWNKHVKVSEQSKVPVSTTSGTGTSTDERVINLPEIDLIEHWGQIETTFGIYDLGSKTYTPGKYEEYIVTGTTENKQLDEIIRCEPSTIYYHDKIEDRDVYLKPFITSIFTVNPGQFYGKSVLEPIESLVSEMKEHHDLYLDEHKRSIMTILSVLERSGLTKKDLPFSPYAHWVMRSHDDVKAVQFPEMNLQAFSLIHGLLDREIDRTSGSPSGMQGVAVSKRQTKGEFEGLMVESSRRFSQFIKMSDHLTLRPTAFKTMLLMRYMPAILKGTVFNLPDQEIEIDPEMLSEEMEFAFAATGIEPEYSKYAKQSMFPQLMKQMSTAAQASNGKYIPNMKEIAKEMDNLYNFKDSIRFVEEARQSIPLDLLKAGTAGDQNLGTALQQILQNAQDLSEIEQERKKKGK